MSATSCHIVQPKGDKVNMKILDRLTSIAQNAIPRERSYAMRPGSDLR